MKQMIEIKIMNKLKNNFVILNLIKNWLNCSIEFIIFLKRSDNTK